MIYFFSGSNYARVTLANNNTMDPGYPLPIAGHWNGLSFPTVEAAVNLGNGKAYFFLGDSYVSYDIAGDAVDAGFPRQIAPDWPGLFPRGIDGAVNWGNGKAYFFSGTQYVRWDIATNRADDGYPLPTSSQWPSQLTSPIDAAVERSSPPTTTPMRARVRTGLLE